MIRTLTPVGALLFSVALLLTGNGLQGTLLPVRGALELFSNAEIGVMGSAYYLGFALGCVFGPAMIQRAGHIRTFTAMAAIASSVALAHAMLVGPAVWPGLRAVTGFCFATLFTVIESWLAERSTNENRGLILAVYNIINLTVITIGQMMLPLGDPQSFALFCVASILVSLAAVPVAMTASPAPAPVTRVRLRIRYLYGISPVGFLGALAVGLANGAFWSLGPAYAQASGLGVTGIALFMSATVIGGAVGQWPLGRLSDKVDRRLVVVGCCAGSAVAALALVFLRAIWPDGLFVLSFLFGIFAFPLYAVCVAHANDHVAADEFTEMTSGLLLTFAGGAVVGPLLASAVMAPLGQPGLFTFTALVHVAAGGFAVLRMRRRERPPEDTRSPFVGLGRTSPVILNLDPRAETPEETPADEPAPDKPADIHGESGAGDPERKTD